jgi:membrane-associated HD superfamily phosphohydrolase
MRSNKSGKLLSLTILFIFAFFLLSVVWTLRSDTKIARMVPLILVLILAILSFIHYKPASKTKQQPLFVPKDLASALVLTLIIQQGGYSGISFSQLL